MSTNESAVRHTLDRIMVVTRQALAHPAIQRSSVLFQRFMRVQDAREHAHLTMKFRLPEFQAAVVYAAAVLITLRPSFAKGAGDPLSLEKFEFDAIRAVSGDLATEFGVDADKVYAYLSELVEYHRGSDEERSGKQLSPEARAMDELRPA